MSAHEVGEAEPVAATQGRDDGGMLVERARDRRPARLAEQHQPQDHRLEEPVDVGRRPVTHQAHQMLMEDVARFGRRRARLGIAHGGVDLARARQTRLGRLHDHLLADPDLDQPPKGLHVAECRR